MSRLDTSHVLGALKFACTLASNSSLVSFPVGSRFLCVSVSIECICQCNFGSENKNAHCSTTASSPPPTSSPGCLWDLLQRGRDPGPRLTRLLRLSLGRRSRRRSSEKVVSGCIRRRLRGGLTYSGVHCSVNWGGHCGGLGELSKCVVSGLCDVFLSG